IKRFCLPPDAKVIYKDATGTEVDAEIFSDLVGQGNVVLTVFSDQEFSNFSLSSASETSDSSFSSSASTIILDDVPSKRQRIEEHFYDAASSTGYISWHLKTVQRKIRRGSALPPNSPIDFSPGGPNFQRTVNVERQLDAHDQEMASLLHLLPPPPGGLKSPKIRACDAVERLVVFH
ncbi:unnamed protein product, partial [Coregonus sp. 'balchen']